MSQYVFGTGQLFAMPVGGGAPLKFGALQDVSVDFTSDNKQLFGQYQFPLSVARGKTKIEWKAASGNIDVNGFNQIYFNQTVTTGNELIQVFNEAGSIPGTGPYTITTAHAANFDMDLGVYDVLTGNPMKQVASAPAAGQYSVAAGVYTFAAADTGKAVLINYLYTSASTGGSLAVNNILMGLAPRFQLVLSEIYDSKSFTMILYSNVADKLSLPLKQDDFLIAEITGQAQADASNRIGQITTTSITGGGS